VGQKIKVNLKNTLFIRQATGRESLRSHVEGNVPGMVGPGHLTKPDFPDNLRPEVESCQRWTPVSEIKGRPVRFGGLVCRHGSIGKVKATAVLHSNNKVRRGHNEKDVPCRIAMSLTTKPRKARPGDRWPQFGQCSFERIDLEETPILRGVTAVFDQAKLNVISGYGGRFVGRVVASYDPKSQLRFVKRQGRFQYSLRKL